MANISIKSLIDENESLKNQVHNLTLYLDTALEKCEKALGHDGIRESLDEAFDGMPGYVPMQEEVYDGD